MSSEVPKLDLRAIVSETFGIDTPPTYYEQKLFQAIEQAVRAQWAAEVDRLENENDLLRTEAAQKLIDSTALTGMLVNGGSLDIGLQGGACGLFAEAFAAQFKESGAENYVTATFSSKHLMPGEQFIVTMQRRSGKTPHDLRREAEAQRDSAQAEAKALRSALKKMLANFESQHGLLLQIGAPEFVAMREQAFAALRQGASHDE